MGLINNNILPYILLVVMGYMLIDGYLDKEAMKKQAQANERAQYETMSIIDESTRERLEKIEAIFGEEWKNGKNTGSY